MLERAPKGEAFFGDQKGSVAGYRQQSPKNTKFHLVDGPSQKHGVSFEFVVFWHWHQLGTKTITGSFSIIARPELSGRRSRTECIVRGMKNAQSSYACSQGRCRSLGISSSAVTCSSPRASHMTAGEVENLNIWSSHLDAGCPK